MNLSDLPELLPGARPSANPAAREEFVRRCRYLHGEAEAAQEQVAVAGQGADATVADLEAMFPGLDAALVREMAADATSPQAALSTLLALSESMGEAAAGETRRAAPREIGVEDESKFPSLVDTDGWQIVSARLLERDGDEDLGSAWRDRARSAASRPAPAPQASAAPRASRARRARAAQGREETLAEEEMTEWEARQSDGRRRVERLARFGGRRGRGAALAPAIDDGREDERVDSGELSPELAVPECEL